MRCLLDTCVVSELTKPKPLADGLIAATAVQHDLTVATRNVGDFEPFGVSIFNPWAE